jgi:hypothetical protein
MNRGAIGEAMGGHQKEAFAAQQTATDTIFKKWIIEIISLAILRH